ncbi:MAG: hypothetical protein DRR42_07365 [Gammaproteobacteria bacterium]|nr:MAG: hypothetical protein DRR42_07365 [Gammaproteobacteria bacterium]
MKRYINEWSTANFLAFGLLVLVAVDPAVSRADPEQNITRNHTLTTALEGNSYEYTYTSGHRYQLRFIDGQAHYQLMAGAEDLSSGAYPYVARVVGPNRYFVQWWAADVKIYVTLLIDEQAREIHSSWNSVSALDFETAAEGLVFDVADIHKIGIN